MSNTHEVHGNVVAPSGAMEIPFDPLENDVVPLFI